MAGRHRGKLGKQLYVGAKGQQSFENGQNHSRYFTLGGQF